MCVCVCVCRLCILLKRRQEDTDQQRTISSFFPLQNLHSRYNNNNTHLFCNNPFTAIILCIQTDLLKSEFERLAARQPMEMLSMKRLEFTAFLINRTILILLLGRYELPQPAAAQRNDLGAWQESVYNSMAQLEHQAGRSHDIIITMT